MGAVKRGSIEAPKEKQRFFSWTHFQNPLHNEQGLTGKEWQSSMVWETI